MAYDDDALGRARVTDTPELEAYYARLEKLEAGALWKVANKIEPWYPQPQSIPVHWRFADLRPLVLEALNLVTGDDAGRRVVALYNPQRRELAATVGLLYSGLQVMGPGEAMTAHRHQAAALRFVIEGTGAWTIVDGQKLKVGPRDFAITPNWTWHEHGNEGIGKCDARTDRADHRHGQQGRPSSFEWPCGSAWPWTAQRERAGCANTCLLCRPCRAALTKRSLKYFPFFSFFISASHSDCFF